LLLFTGGKWCGVCVILEKGILAEPEFADFARKKLVLMKVEFAESPYAHPEEKPSPELKAKLDLARQFNMNIGQDAKGKGLNGYPSVFLINRSGKHVQIDSGLPGIRKGLAHFLEQIEKAIER